MTPHDAILLVPVFAAGSGLGALFFGGLWWTVRLLLLARLPVLWLAGSLVLRFGVSLAGFVEIAGDQWQRWLACLAGFIAVRMLMGRLLPVPATVPAPEWQSHAP